MLGDDPGTATGDFPVEDGLSTVTVTSSQSSWDWKTALEWIAILAALYTFAKSNKWL